MSAAALAVMAWPKISAFAGMRLVGRAKPPSSTAPMAGEPVTHRCSRWPKVARKAGSPIIRAKARMDRGWSLRRSREASVCR